MHLNDYQTLAKRTWPTDRPATDRQANAALGLAGEAGELVDLLKKQLFHGHQVSRQQVQAELGDVLWYVAILAEEFGIALDDVALANVEKLRRRYPEGFSEDASRNRHEAQDGGGALVDVPSGVRYVTSPERTWTVVERA